MNNSPPTARLLLTNATGNVGAAALRCLVRQRPAGTELVAGVRDPNDPGSEHLARAEQGAVEVVPFDFTKPETVGPVAAKFLLSGDA